MNTEHLFNSAYVSSYIQKPDLRLSQIVSRISFNPEDSILDIGCGNGLLVFLLYDKILEYSGVDFSLPFVIDAKKKSAQIKNASFFHSSIVGFCKTANRKYTKILSLDFFNLIGDSDLLDILNNLKLVANKSTDFYFHVPNGNYFMSFLKKHNIYKGFEIEQYRSVAQFKKVFNDCGFEIVDVCNLPHYNKLRLLHFLSYFPVAKEFFIARKLIHCRIKT